MSTTGCPSFAPSCVLHGPQGTHERGVGMSLLTSDGATLRAFADAVLRAAEETLEEVVPVTLAVIGGVLAEAEPGSVALEEEDDGPGLLWATFAGRRMVFRYNTMTAMIELRDGTADGYPMRLFGHRSLQMDIVNFFGSLRREGRI
jgi:hypothetical protein